MTVRTEQRIYRTADGLSFATRRERDQHNMRKWRVANPVKRKAQNDRYAASHMDLIRTKGLRSKRKWKAKNPELALLASAKSNAKIMGREFTITVDDIVIPTHCPILGVRLTPVGFSPRTFNASVDRLDNTKGYVPGNVSIISWQANVWKGARTADQVRALLKYMESKSENRRCGPCNRCLT